MNKLTVIAAVASLAVGGATSTMHAQAQPSTRIPVTKDGASTSSTTTTNSSGTVTTTSSGEVDLTGPLGYTLHPAGKPIYCAGADSAEVAKISIKSDMYNSATMISPDQAKALALCAVPGQLASGKLETEDNRTVYEIMVLPTDKKTDAKVQIDAATGEVINAKQFGGLRGLAGFLRESAARKNNKTP